MQFLESYCVMGEGQLRVLCTLLWRLAGILGACHNSGRTAIWSGLHKKKGDRTLCDNSRGISLLSYAGKVLARILLTTLIANISENVLPESQCGFRKHRSTNDMIFTIRQIQEKCIEQQQYLCMVFIDLTKAFNTINRPTLWEVLKRFGCPRMFLAVLRALHEGAQVRVIGSGSKSEPFNVCIGVRQGCVIAPVIFNLFLAAVMAAVRSDISPADSVSLSYCQDGSLFNLRRLNAKTKVSVDHVTELQCADDAAVLSGRPDGLQRSLNLVNDCYSRAGLK